MNYLKRFFYGLLIGLGKIIPGVSGSLIALSLGVYEKSINSINHFFKDIKKNTIYLFPLGVGILLSIIFSSKIVIKLLNNYYLPTILFFLGLIIGGIQDISKQISIRYTHLTIISFTFILIISLFISNKELVFNNYTHKFIFYIIIGIIDAMCMIIPGISGTAILMMIGCYKMLMELLSNLTNINQIVDNIKIIIPFLIGLTIGIIITIKLVHYLFKNHNTKTYNIIFGFLLSSITYMFITTLKCNYTINQVLIGFVLFITGYILIQKIGSNYD